MNSVHQWLTILCSMCVVGLSACGGDDENAASASPPPTYPAPTIPAPPTVTTGSFKDANVSGLEYSVNGAVTRVTDAGGSFTGIGQSVAFKLGGVNLGSATGRSLVTPIDLVANGSSASIQVQNISRFLLMLDSDNNPNNGIAISSAVRAMAPNWQQVNFATTDLTGALNSIVADVASVDMRVPVVPDAATARAHLEANFLCGYSGAFVGTYGGEDAGYFGLWIFPGPNSGSLTAGRVFGYAYSTITHTRFDLAGGTPLSVSQAPTFSTAYVSTTAPANNFTLNGQFITPEQINGTWNRGSFSGIRMALSTASVYRITGVVQSGIVFVLNVDGANSLSGQAFDPAADLVYSAFGTLNGLTVNATFGGSLVLTGTIDNTTKLLTGTSNLAGGTSQVSGSICKLN